MRPPCEQKRGEHRLISERPELHGEWLSKYAEIVETLLHDGHSSIEKALQRAAEAISCSAVSLFDHSSCARGCAPEGLCFPESFAPMPLSMEPSAEAAPGREAVLCGYRILPPGSDHDAGNAFEGCFWCPSLSAFLGSREGSGEGRDVFSLLFQHEFESAAVVPVRGKDGQGILVAADREPGRIEKGHVAFLEGVGRALGCLLEDGRIESEQNLARLQTLAALTEFGSRIAHKVKNPLAGMMLAATRLKKGLLSGDDLSRQAGIADHLAKSIVELSKSVDKVLEDLPPLQRESRMLDLRDVVRTAYAKAPGLSHADIRFRVEEVPGSEGVPFEGDFSLLVLAVRDLLLDTVTQSPPGSRILIGLRSRGEEGTELVVRAETDAASPETAGDSRKEDPSALFRAAASRIVTIHGGTTTFTGGGKEPRSVSVLLPSPEKRSPSRKK